MDPVRNPYAPGAGQRPPELAGRDRQLQQFEVTLERVAAGRPERCMVLSGLRGVGKTVLLNALRGAGRASGPGGPASSRRAPTSRCGCRWPRPCTRRSARSATGTATRTGSTRWRGAQVASRCAPRCPTARACAGSRRPTCRRSRAGPTPATSSSTSSSCSPTSADLARDLGVGIGIFVDEMQDISTDELAALCGACHEISQQGAPLVVVGAGLPHLPVALAASKSYAERLFRYVVRRPAAARDGRPGAARAGRDRGRVLRRRGARRAYAADRRLPLLRPGLRQGHLGRRAGAARSSVADVREAAPEAEGELAVGFFGARYDRATPAEREYMRAMADLGRPATTTARSPPATSPTALGRKPQSLSPARDGLIKKGLVYSSERGTVAFTVPHFGKFLRGQRG